MEDPGRFTFEVDRDPSSVDIAESQRGFVEFNIEHVGETPYFNIAVFLRDPKGRIVGGAVGEHDAGWLRLEGMFVREEHRGKGYGSAMLAELEASQLVVSSCLGCKTPGIVSGRRLIVRPGFTPGEARNEHQRNREHGDHAQARSVVFVLSVMCHRSPLIHQST